MAGVGKAGTVILLLILCAPAAARHSGASAYGQRFSLSGWLLSVCHPHQPSRGTQRRGSRPPDEPLNALVEQQSRSELSCGASGPAAARHKPFAIPAFILLFIRGENAGAIIDPAFLCTFLI